MRDRSHKIREVLQSERAVPVKAAPRLELVGAQQPSQDAVLQACPPTWKELFLEAMFFQALLESDKEKLTELLQNAERVMVLRAQELWNSSGHRDECGEVDTALAALLSIKTQKLGWRAVSAGGGLR